MSQFDKECLEICGGDTDVYNIISERVTGFLEVLDQEPCNHKNVEIFPNKEGYCIDCAMFFKDTDKIRSSGQCSHENTYEDSNGLHICRDCNTEIEVLDHDAEWRYYSVGGGRSSKDPARCHRSRSTCKGIDKVFQSHNITVPEAIKALTEMKYNKVVGPNTVRGKGREAIVAACLFFAYPKFGEYRTSDYIGNLFDLEKNQMSNGLTMYYRTFPEDRTFHIKPENLLRWILNRTGVNQTHYRKIVAITRYLHNTSSLLKRSSPQSVASAIVYFYLCLNPEYKTQLGLTKNKFAEKAALSDITITKLVREASEVSKCFIEE